jgi:hypothetical protein
MNHTELSDNPVTDATPQSSAAGSTAATAGKRHGRRRARRAAAVTALAVAATATLVATTAAPAQASWYAATVGGSGVNVRDCYHPTVQLPPSTNCTYKATLSAGTSVRIVCQRWGQNINGDAVWDYVVYPGGEGFAADYYIYTGYSSWIPGIDICQ